MWGPAPMKIQEAATKIISCWEHGGRYDGHGNGAYGLIGWEGGQLLSLLNAYTVAGGKLSFNPGSYIDWPELNKLADDPLMRTTQQIQAHKYMTKAIQLQQKHYPFKTPLAQLVLCDMGVNNGWYNNYVLHCGADLAKDAEAHVIAAAMTYRIEVMKQNDVWKLEGIQRRYKFYQGMLSMAVPIGKWGNPAPGVISVNGVKVDLGGGIIEPLMP